MSDLSTFYEFLNSFSLHLKEHKAVFKIPATHKQISFHQRKLQPCMTLKTLYRIAIQHIIVLVVASKLKAKYRLFRN